MITPPETFSTKTIRIIRPASRDELLNDVIANIWKTGIIHILHDRMTEEVDLAEQYSAVAEEIFLHLSHDAHERKWGDHEREHWIEVISRSAVDNADRPRSFHTDEAGLRSRADICLMYSEDSALEGGINRFLPAEALWKLLITENPTLAWRLVSHPVEFRKGDDRMYAPIIRRAGDRTLINFNGAMITHGRDALADEMVVLFTNFLDDIRTPDIIDIPLSRGDAIVWWDGWFLHSRSKVSAGAEFRKYHKVGIVLKPAKDHHESTLQESPAALGDASQSQELVYAQIWKELQSRRKNTTPMIVGIDGINASGKTHLSIGLKRYLTEIEHQVVTIVHLDDFHFCKKQRYADSFGSRAFLERYFNLDRLITEVLRPLRTHGKLRRWLTLLDIATDEYVIVNEYNVPPEGILLVEGVFLRRQPIRDFLDFCILCHVPVGASVARGLQRRDKEWFGSVLDKFHEKYLPGNMRYARLGISHGIADVIIDTTDFLEPKILPEEPATQWPV